MGYQFEVHPDPFDYDLGSRTHIALPKDAPTTRVVLGPGGWPDRGDPAGRQPAPSLRTARSVSDGSLGPVVPLPRELQPASRKAGTCQRKGSSSPMTSLTRNQGTERGAETAVFGRLFLQRMHHLSRFGEGQDHPVARITSRMRRAD